MDGTSPSTPKARTTKGPELHRLHSHCGSPAVEASPTQEGGEAAASNSKAIVSYSFPGESRPITQAELSAGRYSFVELASRLKVPAPVVGMSPSPEVVDQEPKAVMLKGSVSYTLAVGAVPLIRFDGGSGKPRPRVQSEAVAMLRGLEPPLRIVTFVGTGRSGKSATCSALTRQPGEDADVERFRVGHSDCPETDGADVALLANRHGPGTVLVVDCEGRDNPMTEDLSQYRALMVLFFALASQLVHCENGQIRESTIEDLGATIAARDMIRTCSENEVDDLLRYKPDLSLLIIAPRFKYDQERLTGMLQERSDQNSRNEPRRMIRRTFGDLRLRTLADLQDEQYEEQVDVFRSEICEQAGILQSNGMQLTGEDFVELLEKLCEQYADAIESGGFVEPDNAYARVVWGHLQAVKNKLFEVFSKGIPKLEHYEEDLSDFRAEQQSALEDFSSATKRITSDACGEVKGELQKQLQEAVRTLHASNHRFKEAERQRASQAKNTQHRSFKQLLPPHPLVRVLLDSEMQRLRAQEAEHRATLAKDLEGLHSRSTAEDACKDLQRLFADEMGALEADNLALREKVRADTDEVVRREWELFEAALPRLEHWNPILIEEVSRRQSQTTLSAARGLAALSSRGAWESGQCEQQQKELDERMCGVCQSFAHENANFERRDEESCSAVRAALLADFGSAVREASRQPSDGLKVRVLRSDELQGLDTYRTDLHNTYRQRTESIHCQPAVERQASALRRELSEEFEQLRTAQNKAVRDLVQRSHDKALARFNTELPKVEFFQDNLESKNPKDAVLNGFENDVGICTSLGDWQQGLCQQRHKELQEAFEAQFQKLLLKNAEFRRQDEEQVQKSVDELIDRFQREFLPASIFRVVQTDSAMRRLSNGCRDSLTRFKGVSVHCLEAQSNGHKRLEHHLHEKLAEVEAASEERKAYVEGAVQAAELKHAVALDPATSLKVALQCQAQALAAFNSEVAEVLRDGAGPWEQQRATASRQRLQSRFGAIIARLRWELWQGRLFVLLMLGLIGSCSLWVQLSKWNNSNDAMVHARLSQFQDSASNSVSQLLEAAPLAEVEELAFPETSCINESGAEDADLKVLEEVEPKVLNMGMPQNDDVVLVDEGPESAAEAVSAWAKQNAKVAAATSTGMAVAFPLLQKLMGR